ncbi:hypothetical protein EYF80_002514 [Liparis tanakae]|uniref:Uncharacterized protein n=1 Tax=Liparis tanakae TaxID=230148 RepID=A0A4Z2JDH2_9TELE|nr:hypothetical protein EYF80_002514 [Liparis tanakae]
MRLRLNNIDFHLKNHFVSSSRWQHPVKSGSNTPDWDPTFKMQHFTVTATTSSSTTSAATAASTGTRGPLVVISAHAGESSSCCFPLSSEQKHLQVCLQGALLPPHSSTSTQCPEASFRKPFPHDRQMLLKLAGESSSSRHTAGRPEQRSSTGSVDQHSTWTLLLL